MEKPTLIDIVMFTGILEDLEIIDLKLSSLMKTIAKIQHDLEFINNGGKLRSWPHQIRGPRRTPAQHKKPIRLENRK